MGKLALGFVAATSFALLACQPMYGEKPDTLKAPKVITKKGEDDKDKDKNKPKDPGYVDTCNFNSHATPTTQRNQTLAKPLVVAGDRKLDAATKEPAERPRIPVYEKSIHDFADALRKDPYNADATLGLARAYDGLRHKRCAIMLVKRIVDLTTSVKYQTEARAAIAQIHAHQEWFKGYRPEIDRELP